jgi:glutamyl-tRNA synthetase
MDYQYLASLLFSDISQTPEELETIYPKRGLKEGAMVTRMAPSPTGFMHLGNLFGAITDERLAHQSRGIFYLRIEDTDQKREVPGGVEMILSAFSTFSLHFDEGATPDGDQGSYGPYRQRQREKIYKVMAKHLVQMGRAYPCFCTEEELAAIRAKQEVQKENYGYYGKWAVYRNASIEEIEANLTQKKPYVLRFRSNGDPSVRVQFNDLIKGNMEFPENDQDIVLLKSDGIPTYHFAHVVDDHFMRTTHVVRGEEWLATLPVHVELFQTLGWAAPQYAHTSHLMKLEDGSKRKLSKRKDPELALSFYHEEGFPPLAVKEYLMGLLNSNFEEWRLQNPQKAIEEFPFSVEKMSRSGALFDLNKLQDVSKNVISVMDAQTVLDQVCLWAKNYDQDLYGLLTANPDYARSIFSIGRGGPKPRKDITIWSEVKEYVSFFYEELFKPCYPYPERITQQDWFNILTQYQAIYDPSDDQPVWFDKIKTLSSDLGFAPETKLYKKNPQDYKGHVGDVSMVLRIAMTGRTNSPDIYEVMKILGKETVISRLKRAVDA